MLTPPPAADDLLYEIEPVPESSVPSFLPTLSVAPVLIRATPPPVASLPVTSLALESASPPIVPPSKSSLPVEPVTQTPPPAVVALFFSIVPAFIVIVEP